MTTTVPLIVPLGRIRPNPWQTRQDYNPDHIVDLANDIATRGLLQAPAGRLVTDDGQPVPLKDAHPSEGFNNLYVELSFGHNRYRAFLLLAQEDESITSMPVQIREISDREMATEAWVENEQRQDLSPIERALALQKRLDDFDLTQAELAEELGLSRSFISNKLRLLRLPDEARDATHAGDMSERAALALLPMFEAPTPTQESMRTVDDQKFYWGPTPDKIIEDATRGASSDQIREAIGNLLTQTTHSLDSNQIHIPPDHPFDLDDIHSPRCDNCAIRIQRGSKMRCGDPSCLELKSEAWKQKTLEEAHSDLPILTEDEADDFHRQRFTYGREAEQLHEIYQAGCPEGNLRLVWLPDYHGAHKQPQLDGLPENVGIFCQHGKGHECYCARVKVEKAKKSDPDIQERKKRKKKLQQEIIEPTTGIILKTLQDDSPTSWSIILGATFGFDRNIEVNSRQEALERLAKYTAEQLLPWRPTDDFAKTRAEITKYFDHLDLPIPWENDPAAPMRRQIRRIERWLNTITSNTQHLIPEAIAGNITNLEQVDDDLATLSEEEQEEVEDLIELQERIGVCLAILEALTPVVEAHSFDNHLGRWAQTLITSELDSAWWTGTAEKADPPTLKLTLALLTCSDDTERRQRLQERLDERLQTQKEPA